MTTHEAGLAVAITIIVVLLALLLVDRFVREIPFVRASRKKLAAVIAIVAAVVIMVVLGNKPRRDEETNPEPMPEDLDDERFQATDAAADDLDVATSTTDAAANSIRDRTGDRDDELDRLSTELDAL